MKPKSAHAARARAVPRLAVFGQCPAVAAHRLMVRTGGSARRWLHWLFCLTATLSSRTGPETPHSLMGWVSRTVDLLSIEWNAEPEALAAALFLVSPVSLFIFLRGRAATSRRRWSSSSTGQVLGACGDIVCLIAELVGR